MKLLFDMGLVMLKMGGVLHDIAQKSKGVFLLLHHVTQKSIAGGRLQRVSRCWCYCNLQ